LPDVVRRVAVRRHVRRYESIGVVEDDPIGAALPIVTQPRHDEVELDAVRVLRVGVLVLLVVGRSVREHGLPEVDRRAPQLDPGPRVRACGLPLFWAHADERVDVGERVGYTASKAASDDHDADAVIRPRGIDHARHERPLPFEVGRQRIEP
jgi:hypothetical protein